MIIDFTLLTFPYKRLFLFLNSDFETYFLKVIILLIVLSLIFLTVKKKKEKYFDKIFSKTNLSAEKKCNEIDADSISRLIQLALGNDPLFFSEFTIAFPDFFIKLQKINSTLKTSDVEFCAMVRLNLDTKQIATIKNATVKSVESKKYRLRKKLNIPPNADMYLWISKI